MTSVVWGPVEDSRWLPRCPWWVSSEEETGLGYSAKGLLICGGLSCVRWDALKMSMEWSCKLLHTFAVSGQTVPRVSYTSKPTCLPRVKGLCVTAETTRGKYRATLQSLGTRSHFPKGHSKNEIQWETNFVGYSSDRRIMARMHKRLQQETSRE